MSTLRHVVVSLALGAALAFAAHPAVAGDCPECQSAADCPRPGSFCVRHNSSVGCGTRLQLCCPGQGCSTASGRPSCEAAGTCTVITGGTDAGGPPSDVGVAPVDAGARTDTGTSVVDVVTTNDASTLDVVNVVDGGTPPSAGCGCRAAGARTSSRLDLGAIGLALAAIGLRRRGRRAA